MSEAAPDILLVSTADWDNPYWTNKQHVALELNARGHRVLYVESQGLRRPTATTKDAWRILRRLVRGFTPPRQVRDGLWIWSPLAIPLQEHAVVRWINRTLTQLGVTFWTAALGLRPQILWTYSPLTTEFYRLDRYPLTVYHAVDDIKAQPGMPREVIARAEQDLATRCHLVFTTSENLQSNLSRLNPNTYYFPNVADFRHFSTALEPGLAIPADLACLPAPRIGFVGAVSSYKLDMQLIADIARRRPDWTFVFVGEVGEGDPLTTVDAFAGLDNVKLIGGRPYATLPAYLKGFDVAIIPSLLNEYTKSMFPMKFFEYLAAGKQVVTTPLQALQSFSAFVHMGEDATSFEASVENALAGHGPALAKRLTLAREHTYEARTEKMMRIVNQRMGVTKPVAA